MFELWRIIQDGCKRPFAEDSMKIVKTEKEFLVKCLHRKLFPGDHWPNDKLNAYWLVYDKSKPVGFAVCRPVRSDDGTVFLSRAAIFPKYEGRGIHKKLIKARLRWCKGKGYSKVITYCTWDNVKSLRNLLQCGLRPYMPSDLWAGEYMIYLQKDL